MESISSPIIITGNGTIRPATGDTLFLRDITIPAGSLITAVGLTIEKRLAMEGAGRLVAAPGDFITWQEDVETVLTAEEGELPFLDLGEVSRLFESSPNHSAPQSVQILGLGSTDPAALPQKLISGRTLNCLDWKNASELDSDRLTLESLNTTASSAKRLADTDAPEISLALVFPRTAVPRTAVPRTAEPRGAVTSPLPDDSSNGGLIAGVVVGVVIVVVGVAAAIGFLVIRKKDSEYSDHAELPGHNPSSL
jgi:hypothetical protein